MLCPQRPRSSREKGHQFRTGVLHRKGSDFSRCWIWNEIADL
jgi:hypothetical protein